MCNNEVQIRPETFTETGRVFGVRVLMLLFSVYYACSAWGDNFRVR